MKNTRTPRSHQKKAQEARPTWPNLRAGMGKRPWASITVVMRESLSISERDETVLHSFDGLSCERNRGDST